MNDSIDATKKVKKKSKGHLFNHTVIKCKLVTILKNKDWLSEIQQRVYAVNKIKIEAYFFFNQYILSLLETDKLIGFDYSTIERCALFVLGIAESDIRKKDDEYTNMMKVYKDNYLTLNDNKVGEYKNIKSITEPFQYISRELMNNIINHVNLNFKRFQRIYVKTYFDDIFVQFKLSKSLLISLLNCILYHINNDTDKIIIRSEKLNKLENLKDIIPVMRHFILTMKEQIPNSFKNNITNDNLKEKYVDVLKYYYKIVKNLEDLNRKRFSVLPQLQLGYSNVKFDSRFISTIYDSFINKEIVDIDNKIKNIKETKINKNDIMEDKEKDPNKKKIKKEINEQKRKELTELDNKRTKVKSNITGIKKFEEKYKNYYKKCFKFSELKYPKHWNPISITTNGYSVNILFEVPKKHNYDYQQKITKLDRKIMTKHKRKNIAINCKENEIKQRQNKGLYDISECSASDEFLDNFHLMGGDPGNDVILYVVSECGKRIIITKAHYNEISHIKRNNKKIKKNMKESKMAEVYQLLSETSYKKTVKLENYMKYIIVMRENWDKIWNFYGQNKVQKLQFDTYINKKKHYIHWPEKYFQKNAKNINIQITNLNLLMKHATKH